MTASIGIDFGTSNSTVGFWDRGTPRLIPLEGHKRVIPSAVFYDLENDMTLYGRDAISAYVDQVEGRLLRSLKSVLGSSLALETTQIGRSRYSFQKIINSLLKNPSN